MEQDVQGVIRSRDERASLRVLNRVNFKFNAKLNVEIGCILLAFHSAATPRCVAFISAACMYHHSLLDFLSLI